MMLPIETRSWTPLRAFEALQAQLERAGRSPFRPVFPPVDVHRREDRVLLRALVPGLTPEALRLEVDGDVVTIAGTWPEETVEGLRSQHLERPQGPFERRLQLPFEVDPTRVEARLENGVLQVELSRVPETAPVKIQVRSQPLSGE